MDDLLNIIGKNGILLLSFLVFAGWYISLVFWLRNKNLEESRTLIILRNILIAFGTLYLIYSLTCFLEVDEIEHIYSSWLVYKGQVPYRDFFQHHHAFLWYIYSLVFKVAGQGLFSVMIIRFINFAFLSGILFFIYKTAFELTHNEKFALYSLAATMSVDVFMRVGLAVRPDVLMALFATGSFYFFSRSLKRKRDRDIIISGLLMAFSFITLQKAVFYILPIFLILPVLVILRKGSIKQILLFGIASAIPVVLFVLLYMWSGQFKEYMVYNWFFNFYRAGRNPIGHLFPYPYLFILATGFSLFLAISVYYFFKKIKESPCLLNVAFIIGFTSGLVISLLPTVFAHYYVLAIPFLFIPVGFFISKFFDSNRITPARQLLILFLFFGFSIPTMVNRVQKGTLFRQMKTINYIKMKAGESGQILSTYPKFLFIEPCHFQFYYANPLNSASDVLAQIIKNPNYQYWITPKMRNDLDYDPMKTIKEKKPVFVLVKKEYLEKYRLDSILSVCYKPSIAPDLYERIDEN